MTEQQWESRMAQLQASIQQVSDSQLVTQRLFEKHERESQEQFAEIRETIGHMATAIVPKIYDAKLADEDLGIATEDAYKMAIRLAREEGLLVGISAAAAVVGCLKVAAQRKKGQQAVMVTILCDSGDKYLSERFWTET